MSTARIQALDALRGFALCGILLVNIPGITYMHSWSVPGEQLAIPFWLDLLVHERFFPIFSFLFGMSFALFLDGSASRAPRPRVLLLRRLLVLAGLGAVHHLAQAGEALLPYAVFGLVVLLPATWLPRWAILAGGVTLTLVAVIVANGGMLLIPGLFLLGLATARYGIAHTLDRRTGQIAAVCAAAAVGSGAALFWESGFALDDPLKLKSSAIAGLLMAVVYSTGLILLLRTRVGPALSAFFEPLGAMALTNYLGATLLVLAADPLLGLSESTRWTAALALAVGILAVQSVFSTWWMRRFRYGPMEWAWRCATWWQLVPIRRSEAGSVHSGLS